MTIEKVCKCPICNKYRYDGILLLRKDKRNKNPEKACFICIREYNFIVSDYWKQFIFRDLISHEFNIKQDINTMLFT